MAWECSLKNLSDRDWNVNSRFLFYYLYALKKVNIFISGENVICAVLSLPVAQL